MDNYVNTNQNCIVCGDCIDACEFDGRNYLTLSVGGYDQDGEPYPPMIKGAYENAPCDECDGFWENQAPCQMVCENDAIVISRC